VPYIQECRAPDLSDISNPVSATYLLNVVFRGPPPENYALRSYLTNFIRNTDRAIDEYERARQLLIDYIGSANRTLLFIRAMSHFETSIHSVKRAHRFFVRLRAHPDGPAIERVAGKLLDKYGQQITDIRDTVEHIDERVERGELADGSPIALFMSKDGERLEIGDLSMSLMDLANALRRLHAFAVALADPITAFQSPPT
jgi:hypothetical protein